MNKQHGRENDSVEVVQDVPKSDIAKREEEILAFWQQNDIFNKSVETPAGGNPVGDFVFYDGPPFATGLPHYGHIIAGTIKDAIPRFWTMNGYRVRRTWGWDCHGLPLENLIEKELGLATKRDIEEYGVKNFNEKARGAVMRYADDWRRIVPRMGRFVDMENDYKTMDSDYTESVWWVFKQLHEKGLVYEGFKSMHLCPRCGTTLSNFEVNQGYKDIKDIAVTVKLPLLDEAGQPTDTSLLVWTTTPWTLPGNLAAAIHKDIEYRKITFLNDYRGRFKAGETYIASNQFMTAELLTPPLWAEGESLSFPRKTVVKNIEGEAEIIDHGTFRGAALVGKKYQPPFTWLKEAVGKGILLGQNPEDFDRAWTIYHADYVEEGEEGTGAVHIAPAYGEDDMNLAKEHNVPIVHHVDSEGKFKDFVTDFAGQLVKPKDDEEAEVTHLDADILVVRKLNELGLLLKKENITHSYPHCWRCETPLLNYGTTSWFVEVTKIRDDLVKANTTVKWLPEHVGTNRFGKWLEGARDWAISRQRYWGAPLPIWKNPETGVYKVFGSLADLQEYLPKSGNTYYTLRHGESDKNVAPKIVTDDPDAPYHVTKKGIKDVQTTVSEVLKDGVDLIISSPVLRAKETARLAAKELGMSVDDIIYDERIGELDHGVCEGWLLEDFKKQYPVRDMFERSPEDGETYTAVRQRMGDFLYDLEKRYSGKRILIVSHGDPTTILKGVSKGSTKEEIIKYWSERYPIKGRAEELQFSPIPHNDDYELDFHRPYIDEIALYENGVKLERVRDVFDCWFESGSMPYGQHHYPFENEKQFTKEHFPAQFIAEGLDQTRGWFYSMLVLGVALFGKSPYENVIVNGLVLAEDGKKMSKSLQNYPDPMDLANRQGVDSMRFYLLSSPAVKGEDLSFSEKEVNELQRKNIGRLHNVLAMYEMFADGTLARDDSKQVLDRWIIARLRQLVTEVTAGYKEYELDKATRPITDFIDDLSVWYLRRSRDRLKGEDTLDRQHALATLRYTLRTLALTIAPSMPFYAEYLWQAVKEEDAAESVHLAKWPEDNEHDPVVIGEMSMVREFVTLALEARTKAGIKVRQPLSTLSLNVEMDDEYKEVIADEVNVKKVVYESKQTERAILDTKVSEVLLAEGAVRELMRAVQERRKTEGLAPADRVNLTVQTDSTGRNAVEANQELLTKTVGAAELAFADTSGDEVTSDAYRFVFSIKKV